MARFIELHLTWADLPILVNVERIEVVEKTRSEKEDSCKLIMKDGIHYVKESFEEIKKLLSE